MDGKDASVGDEVDAVDDVSGWLVIIDWQISLCGSASGSVGGGI